MGNKKEVNKEALGISGFTLAMAGIFSLLIFGPLSIALFIVGGIFCFLQQKRHPTKLGKIGLIINIIGVAGSIIWWIVLIKIVYPLIQEQLGNIGA